MSIDQLRKKIEDGQIRLNWGEMAITRDLRKWIALREGDRDALRRLVNWDADRAYKHDPLAHKISKAFADFLYGENPEITATATEDNDLLSNIVRENDLVNELHRGVEVFSSEGEVWWRIYTDPDQAEVPLLEWHSRTVVQPLWRGRKLAAVAFIYDVERQDDKVVRYIQYHEDGRVVNALYENSRPEQNSDPAPEDVPAWDQWVVGTPLDLQQNSYTKGLEEEWDHDQGMLAGRLINNAPKTRKLGKSDYDGVEDLLLDLNEAHTIDAENFRLAGKKRAVMDKKYRDQAGNASGGEEILWADEDTDEMEEGKQVFKILEYSYNGSESVARKEDLERTILTRVGIARQFVDANSAEGFAPSGTALRVRLIPTTLAATGKAREFDDRVPRIIRLMQRVDALEEGKGGFGRTWKNSDGLPSVKRSSILPEDDTESAQRHQTLMTSELESVEQAILEMHPDWSVEQRLLEVKRIIANRQGFALDDDGKPIVVEGAPLDDGGGEVL